MSDGDSPTNAPQVQAQAILEAAAEAFMTTISSWEPTNDAGEVAAGAVRQLFSELPGFVRTLEQGLAQAAEKCAEVVWMDDGGAELIHKTSEYIGAAAEPLSEAAVMWDDLHRPAVDRIERGDDRDAAWDVSRHSA